MAAGRRKLCAHCKDRPPPVRQDRAHGRPGACCARPEVCRSREGADRSESRPRQSDSHSEGRSPDGQDHDDACREPRSSSRGARLPGGHGARPPLRRGGLRAGAGRRGRGRCTPAGRGGDRRRRRRGDGQGHLDHLSLRAGQRDRAPPGAARGRQHSAPEPRPARVPGVLRGARRRVRARGREPGAGRGRRARGCAPAPPRSRQRASSGSAPARSRTTARRSRATSLA